MKEFTPINHAVTGLYFLDGTAPKRAKDIKSSQEAIRNYFATETYLKDDNLHVEKMGNGYAWLDTGTHSSLLTLATLFEPLSSASSQVGSLMNCLHATMDYKRPTSQKCPSLWQK